MTMIENIRGVYNNPDDENLDRASVLVETVLITAALAVVTLVVMKWFGIAIFNKGADTASCIETSNTSIATTSTGSSNSSDCSTVNHASSNSFQKDSDYQSRFGNS